MQNDAPPVIPSNEAVRAHILSALIRYWPNHSALVDSLPIVRQTLTKPISGPLRLIEVKLPEWATDCGVDGCLLIPQEVTDHQLNSESWLHTDWWLAAFLLLEAWHERVWEYEYGPIHSYSFRLIGWDERAWQFAWVNRIGLFLRQWAMQNSAVTMDPLPKLHLQMTHDVDAVAKTLPIRLKQGAFNLFNAIRSLRCGQFRQMCKQVGKAFKFMVGREIWWAFDQIQNWEADADVHAIYHFHSDRRPKTFKRWIFDPSYDISAPKQLALLRQLTSRGHKIGLHPGFQTWKDSEEIALQRSCLEAVAGIKVTHCRQHWLRFSWRDTWSAQQSAHLTHDTTLMFNDRPGFRNSSALSWHPFNPQSCLQHSLNAMPTVFMDSHFYDYQLMTVTARQKAMLHWIQECHAIAGEVALLWHPHTLNQDFGWTDGFLDAISLIREFE